MKDTKTAIEVFEKLDEDDRIAVLTAMGIIKGEAVPPCSKKAERCIALLKKEKARTNATLDAEWEEYIQTEHERTRAVRDCENLRFLLWHASDGLRMPNKEDGWTIHIKFSGKDADEMSQLLFQTLGYLRNDDFSLFVWNKTEAHND